MKRTLIGLLAVVALLSGCTAQKPFIAEEPAPNTASASEAPQPVSPFPLLVVDEDGNPVLDDDEFVFTDGLTCYNVEGVQDALEEDKFDADALKNDWGIDPIDRLDSVKIAIGSINAECKEKEKENTAPEESPTPTPSPSATAPTPEVASPTRTPATEAPPQVPYDTWADVIVALPQGISDTVNRQSKSLGWSWKTLARLAAGNKQVQVMELRYNSSCSVIASTPGGDGCGEGRFVLLPLGSGTRTGLVEYPEGQWSLVVGLN